MCVLFINVAKILSQRGVINLLYKLVGGNTHKNYHYFLLFGISRKNTGHQIIFLVVNLNSIKKIIIITPKRVV